MDPSLTVAPPARSATRRLVRRRAAAAALAVAAIAGCGGGDAATEPVGANAGDGAPVSEHPAYGLVSPAAAAALAVDPEVVVIDVRTPEEFAEGHIEGATLIDFNAPGFADAVAELDTEQDYLVYCRSGNRSGQAVALMRQLGVVNVWDMDGGVVAWSAEGRPLER